jgi:hypothetical protein
MTVTGSTIYDNHALVQGGGISNYDGGILHIVNSTVSGNAAATGGGIFNSATADIQNSTVVTNAADDGGNIYVDSGASLELINTILAHNGGGDDCSGNVVSSGHNIDSDDSCNLTASGDMPNTDLVLNPLQNNGGPTWTHALESWSPAVDAGDDSVCPAKDQRGVPRPQLQACDIGAFEYDGLRTIFVPLIMMPAELIR